MTNKQSTDDVSERHHPGCYSLDPPIPGVAMCNCGVTSYDEGKAAGRREAVEKLEPWLQHNHMCDAYEESRPMPCVCGLTALLDELKGEGSD